MTKNRHYFIVLTLFLFVVIVWAPAGMLKADHQNSEHKVSVILDNCSSDRWISLRQGLEQAAEEHHVVINYVSTDTALRIDEQIDLINTEIENGAEGIIVRMIASDDCVEEMESISQRTALMLLESDIGPEDVYALTAPDNQELGRALANAILDRFGQELSERQIGILYGNQSLISMQQRLKGLEEVLSENNTRIVWRRRSVTKDNYQELQRIDSADIIVALGNDETEQMADYIMMTDHGDRERYLYGIGCSEKVVYHLDKGLIDMLVVPNDFSMGYQSMEAIAKQLRYHLSAPNGSKVDYLIINKQNLYDEENQKVLFPIVQ